ncbi:hypothetical protein WMY93_009003 [Mugilogobius chulae]|uniref:Leptin receptor n=1 Tax=Mugilogobius chulae TaxID=88201 RepID=A0AAW0PBJ8_9GOBI
MDSWTLQGDSYSFLRSAPRTFSLCHRDGTPNHVEIFDIINTPTQRSAISETTCLCDIFGDDCESASLSSSPASAAFSPQCTEVEGRAEVSPIVDDNNDSSGSYHTAHSSSDEEEGLEDPIEKQNSAELHNLVEKQKSSDCPVKTIPAHSTISPVPQEQATSSNLQTVCDEILPSLKNNTPQTQSQLEVVHLYLPQERVSLKREAGALLLPLRADKAVCQVTSPPLSQETVSVPLQLLPSNLIFRKYLQNQRTSVKTLVLI